MYNSNNTNDNQVVLVKSVNRKRLGIVVFVLVLMGVGTYGYLNYCDDSPNQDLGTYSNPEEAFRETQKALLILSVHLKIGTESVQYIREYDNSKNLIFKQSESK